MNVVGECGHVMRERGEGHAEWELERMLWRLPTNCNNKQCSDALHLNADQVSHE